MDESLKTLLEEALNKKHEEMMQQFSWMLEKWELHVSPRNSKFGRKTPFKVQVNFDIPTFQGKIDAWEVHLTTKEIQESQDGHEFSVLFDGKPTWEEFVKHIKQEYYLKDTYEQKYMQWQLLWQKKDQ